MTNSSASPTQTFVPIQEIRNGVIILKNGGYRGVLICSSINFSLKGESEQLAIITGFQNFLNTLDFSVQIVVKSRKMDLRPYLSFLEGKAVEQKTELLRIQLREYVNFVRSFTDRTNIMTKTFYVIVPYTPSGGARMSQSVGIFGKSKSGSGNITPDETFQTDRAQLEQRLALVAEGLAGTGVRATTLGTEEIIELLYRSFNPGELENPIRLDA